MKTRRASWHTIRFRSWVRRRPPGWMRSALAGLAISVLAGHRPVLAYLCESPGVGCVLSPDSTFRDRSYGAWSALYWQWLLALPKDQNPEKDGEDCRNGANGQSGPVWFLAQGGITLERHCTVPAQKALFFPVVAGECSTLERPPYHGDDEVTLRSCIRAVLDQAVAVRCELDGVPMENLSLHRVQSPPFEFTVPDNNLLEAPAGTGLSVADGVYVLLWELKPGLHTIHTHAEVPAHGFVQDITYHLTVELPPWLTIGSANGVPVLEIGGEVGRQYVVEYASSLSSGEPWTALPALTLTNSPQSVVDPTAATAPQRFYRARLAP